MDIQALLDMHSEKEMYRRVAAGENISLGGMIDALEAVPDKGIPIAFDSGQVPVSVDSYRGYYRDLAIQTKDWSREAHNLGTVALLLAELKSAVGKTFEGYKGGEFTMALHTPLWCAEYGCCGRRVTGIHAAESGVVIVTAPDED